jgi:DNA helicase-2/ATP-dependent DNA helicase PcrA
MIKLLTSLNTAQAEAVTSLEPKILCLAGAGTGKTRALTHRIAYLHTEQRVSCNNMLALTFTRLAGKEMKDRIKSLIGSSASNLFCNTFHAWCVNVLMHHADLVKRSKDFTIFDEDDKRDIITAIISDLGLKTAKISTFMAAMRPEPKSLDEAAICSQVDREYEYRLKKYNAFDFDSLISSVITIFRKHPGILKDYSDLYEYVLLDEFQDTSNDQWELIQLLNPKNLFVVGDDFQAIYGWRRANIDIIMALEKDPDWHVVKLEDNYRSTHEIVNSANKLISYNTQTEKTLIAHKSGIPIKVTKSDTPDDEAEYIAFEIGSRCADSIFSNYAVLARTNAMAAAIKNTLSNYYEIPAEVVNKQMDIFKVYDVAMVLKFINFALNRESDVTFKRIINYPRTRLSKLDFQDIERGATLYGTPLYVAFDAQRHQQLIEFQNLLNQISTFESTDALDQVKNAIAVLGIKDEYIAQTRTTKAVLLDNACAAITRWQTYQLTIDGDISIYNFLHWISIRDSLDILMDNKNMVKVMTVHASKGLEFDNVFVAGLNQDVFPSKRGDIEEERRLFYVAITRAREKLQITYSKSVFDWGGQPMPAVPSIFIDELQL